jgi:hypothetical protein
LKQPLTAAEVGEVLGVPASWVYAEARAGSSIEEWAKGLERGPTTSAPRTTSWYVNRQDRPERRSFLRIYRWSY